VPSKIPSWITGPVLDSWVTSRQRRDDRSRASDDSIRNMRSTRWQISGLRAGKYSRVPVEPLGTKRS